MLITDCIAWDNERKREARRGSRNEVNTYGGTKRNDDYARSRSGALSSRMKIVALIVEW